MKRLSPIAAVGIGECFCLAVLAGLGAAVNLALASSPPAATPVRVRDGQTVRLRVHNLLTTENVEKGDIIEFDVADDVVVANHVVIAKGAPGHGRVVRVKGQGKKQAKDACVTFVFLSVRAVDNQEIPIRATANKPRKRRESREDEVDAREVIPEQVGRVIGAEKGTEYAAYTDAAVVNAPEAAPAPVSPPAAGGALVPQGQQAPAVAIPEQELGSIDFTSNPVGADINIDGSFRGTTPSSLRVPAGRHTLEIRLAGYRAWTRTIVVDPGSHPTIRVTLEKE